MAEIFKSNLRLIFYLAFVYYKQLGLKILVDIAVILSISHTGILDQCQCLEERNRASIRY